MSMLVNRNGHKTPLPALRLTKGDILILALVLVLALVLLLRPAAPAGTVCIVTWDGGEAVLPLDTPDTLVLESRGIRLTVQVDEGCVWVAEAGCPDGVCRRTGQIRYAGEIIVCVPADAVVRIPGQTEEDFIAG